MTGLESATYIYTLALPDIWLKMVYSSKAKFCISTVGKSVTTDSSDSNIMFEEIVFLL
jgi:hypothetical protein